MDKEQLDLPGRVALVKEELMQQFPTTIMSEDFAIAMGLVQGEVEVPRLPEDEVERLRMISILQARNGLEGDDQQDVIWSRFCALYLPATISKFIDPPTTYVKNPYFYDGIELMNAYFLMLSTVQHSPYVAKYLRSSDPRASDNKHIAPFLASQILRIASLLPIDEGHNYPRLSDALKLLSTVCLVYVKRDIDIVVPKEIRDPLSVFLEIWAIRHRNQFIGEVSGEMLTLFNLQDYEVKGQSGNGSLKDEYKKFRRRLAGWDKCGMPNCDKINGLKSCGRCKTVQYCCPEHQKIHWSLEPVGHKRLCHVTLY